MAVWIRTDAVPWLVSGRPEPQPVVGGVTFGAGFLHQPVAWLGVTSLLGAVLVSVLPTVPWAGCPTPTPID